MLKETTTKISRKSFKKSFTLYFITMSTMFACVSYLFSENYKWTILWIYEETRKKYTKRFHDGVLLCNCTLFFINIILLYSYLMNPKARPKATYILNKKRKISFSIVFNVWRQQTFIKMTYFFNILINLL